MALAPARTKYRKVMKGSRAGNAKRGNTLAFGEFGLQSLTRGPMTGQQIEAARVTISRHLKRKGKLWPMELFSLSYRRTEQCEYAPFSSGAASRFHAPRL